MRKVHSFRLGAALLAVGFASVWAKPPAAPGPATPAVEATSPAATAPLDPYAQDLLTRLNSTNPAEREAAQRQLASIAGLMQSQELLARLQEATTDPDLKDFFATRVSQIKAKEEERRITNLPLISLDVSDANVIQLAAALNEALGTPNKFTGINSGNRIFTFKARNKPFWDIFARLSQQEPLSIQSMGSSTGSSLRLIPSGTAIRRYALSGPAMAYVNNVSYQRIIRLQNQNAGDDSWGMPSNNQGILAISLTVLMDPRVRMTRYMYPTLISAVDDAGNNLATPRAGSSSFMNSTSGQINHSFSMPAPNTLGNSLDFVCEMRFVAVANELTGAIDDVENNLNKPVTVGTRTFRVMRFATQGNMSMQINATDNAPNDGARTAGSMAIPYTLTDGTGRVIWSTIGSGIGTSTHSFGAPGATGPFKLEFRVPDKSIEIPARFEFKGMPLP